MKKIIILPDSFKGTLSSAEICTIVAAGARAHFPHAQIIAKPIADGGEGVVEAFLQAVGGEKKHITVRGPLQRDVQAHYGLLAGEPTAIVEMALCAGLPLMGAALAPLEAGTYGVGQMLLHAAHGGAEKIIVGLGGSASTDGGCGAAAAAGVRFMRATGEAFVPTGGTLRDIAAIDASRIAPCLAQAQIVALCDVDNPLHGPSGAAHVFAPQKGADARQVALLDEGLRHLATLLARDLGWEGADWPGCGAAGGLAAGLCAFFGARMRMGIDVLLDALKFEEMVADADVIITGEGRMDGQSLRGKAVMGIARRAKPLGIPVIALVGAAADGVQEAYAQGVTSIFTINRAPLPFEEAAPQSAANLAFAADNLFRLCKGLQK